MQEYAPPATLQGVGLNPAPIERIDALIEAQIAEGGYPRAQYAIARHDRVVPTSTFRKAPLAPDSEAKPDILSLMFSSSGFS